jgi:hypothetical protein
MRSCSNRVIELNPKMLILTRFNDVIKPSVKLIQSNIIFIILDHIPHVSLEEFNI